LGVKRGRPILYQIPYQIIVLRTSKYFSQNLGITISKYYFPNQAYILIGVFVLWIFVYLLYTLDFLKGAAPNTVYLIFIYPLRSPNNISRNVDIKHIVIILFVYLLLRSLFKNSPKVWQRSCGPKGQGIQTYLITPSIIYTNTS